MVFMCWTRETGVTPAALVGLLVGMDAPARPADRVRHFYCDLNDRPYSGADHQCLGSKLGLLEKM